MLYSNSDYEYIYSTPYQSDLSFLIFRRQEHLKRHYRLLHTHDKPFECTDYGRKFRQHRRHLDVCSTTGSMSKWLSLMSSRLTEMYVGYGSTATST